MSPMSPPSTSHELIGGRGGGGRGELCGVGVSRGCLAVQCLRDTAGALSALSGVASLGLCARVPEDQRAWPCAGPALVARAPRRLHTTLAGVCYCAVAVAVAFYFVSKNRRYRHLPSAAHTSTFLLYSYKYTHTRSTCGGRGRRSVRLRLLPWVGVIAGDVKMGVLCGSMVHGFANNNSSRGNAHWH